MAETRESFEYQVVFEGRLLDGFIAADVRAAFGIRFGEEAANTVFTQPRIVLKQKLALPQAQKVQAALSGIGMRTKLERLPVHAGELRLVDESTTPGPAAPAASEPAADAEPAPDGERDRGIIAGRAAATKVKAGKTYAVPVIEAAFPGPLAMAPVSAAYKKRLVGVAALMLLLPAIYGAIALASLFLTYWLAMPGRDLFFSAMRPGYISVVGFGAVCLAAFLFTAFLFRPFFARRERGLRAVSLDPVREPVLHALVEKIAEATGAPMPCEILVDANVNASASLSKGVLSRDLTLTIGLPLFWGCDVRSLTGVLAHELGHFSQRYGMRASRMVFGINHWFYRQVHERDRWDEFVERLGERDFALFGLASALAQLGSFLCRLLLASLAQAAGVISMSFSRQMEFDADRYEIALVGSEHYEHTAKAMRLLGAAQARVLDEIGGALAAGTMADNLPCMFARRAAQFTDQDCKRILAGIEEMNTSVFDTHPADQERIRAARQANAASRFDFEGSAQGLLRELERLSKVTTLQWYRALGFDVQPSDLVPVASVEAEVQQLERATQAAEEYFDGLTDLGVWMHCPEPRPFAQRTDAELATERDQLRDQVELGRKENIERREQLRLHREYISCYAHALFWSKLGVAVEPTAYRRKLKVGSVAQIDANLAEHRGATNRLERELAEFASLLGRRLALDLELAGRREPGRLAEIGKLRGAWDLLGSAASKDRTLIASCEQLAMLVEADARKGSDARRQREISREFDAETGRNEHLQSAIRQLLAAVDPAISTAAPATSAADPVRRAQQALEDAAQLLNRLERLVRGTRGRMAELAS